MFWSTEYHTHLHAARMRFHSLAQVQVVSVGQDRKLTFWDLREVDPVHAVTQESENLAVALSASGNLVASGGKDQVCVSVCVCVCVYICLHIYTYIHLCVCTYMAARMKSHMMRIKSCVCVYTFSFLKKGGQAMELRRSEAPRRWHGALRTNQQHHLQSR